MHSGSCRLRVVIFSFLALLSCPPALAQQAADKLELPERVSIASRIYAAVQVYYAHSEAVPFPEIEAAYRRYLEELVRAPERREFDLATLRFFAALKNSHTHFRDSWLDASYGQPLPFWLAPVEGQWVIARTADERLRKGEIVEAIDGVSVDEFVRRQAESIGASSPRIACSWVFYSPALFPQRLTLTLEHGRQVQVERGAKAPRSGTGQPAETPRPSSTEGRWITEDSVAYLKIPSFGDPRFERSALELVKRYQAARCLIVDVRGNGGGSTPWQLIGALMNRPWQTWRKSTPQRIALYEAQGEAASQLQIPSQEVPAAADAFAGRLILLVDRYTGSASEDFVMPFKCTGRAVVVGETTQGSSGQPYRLDLGSGMSLTISAVRYRFPDGSPFEGVGIRPDVLVEPQIADVRDDVDPVLQKARELAEATPTPPRPAATPVRARPCSEHCSSNGSGGPTGKRAAMRPGAGSTSARANEFTAYGINWFFLGTFYDGVKIKSPDGQTYVSVKTCNLAQVTAPAQTYMLAESSWRYDKQLSTDGVIYAIYPPEMPKDWTWAHPYGCLTSRHSSGGNIAFCDGHVRWSQPDTAYRIENFRTVN
jgi:carboxyl-terminal processing protease